MKEVALLAVVGVLAVVCVALLYWREYLAGYFAGGGGGPGAAAGGGSEPGPSSGADAAHAADLGAAPAGGDAGPGD